MRKNGIKTRHKLPKVRYSLDLYKEGKYFIGAGKGLDYTGVDKTIDEAIKNTNKSYLSVHTFPFLQHSSNFLYALGSAFTSSAS